MDILIGMIDCTNVSLEFSRNNLRPNNHEWQVVTDTPHGRLLGTIECSATDAVRAAIRLARRMVLLKETAAVAAARQQLPTNLVAAVAVLRNHIRTIPDMSGMETRHNCEHFFGPIPPAVWDMLCKKMYLD